MGAVRQLRWLAVALAAACGPRGIDADDLARAPVSFAAFPYTPVGPFAASRNAERGLPFVDVDQDGELDPGMEATGRCRASTCRVDPYTLRVMSRTSACGVGDGLWWVGSAFDGRGRRVPSRLCDESRGACSEPSKVFRDTPTEEGLQEPSPTEVGATRTLALWVGDEVVRRAQVEIPPPLDEVRVETRSEAGRFVVTATAEQSIDLASLWMTREDVTLWTSAPHPEMFESHGETLIARLPDEAIAACADDCGLFLAVAHVWRDDDVLVASENLSRVE